MNIRPEKENDYDAVYYLNSAAFKNISEANLVNNLRENVNPYISLVCEIDKNSVGNIMFTPVTLIEYPDLKIMGLAPMAVLPEYQKNGIGSELIREGINKCKDLDYIAIVVLGHSEYYPRFGFIPSINFNISCEYEVPAANFMILELVSNSLQDKSGIIKYNNAFTDL